MYTVFIDWIFSFTHYFDDDDDDDDGGGSVPLAKTQTAKGILSLFFLSSNFHGIPHSLPSRKKTSSFIKSSLLLRTRAKSSCNITTATPKSSSSQNSQNSEAAFKPYSSSRLHQNLTLTQAEEVWIPFCYFSRGYIRW